MTDTALVAPAKVIAAPVARARWLARRAWVPIAALTLLAAALRFLTLDAKGYWGDELSTVFLVRLPPDVMFAKVARLESTPPFYSCVAWVWARIFGTSEVGLRSLSALIGTATIPVAWWTARRFVSRPAALVAAGLLAVNPFLVWYSQEARSYALLILLATLTVLLAVRALEQPTGSRCWAWAVMSGLALATHYFAAFLVIPEAVALVRRRDSRRPVILPLAAVGAAAAALLPLALTQRSYGHANWISHSPLPVRLLALPGNLLVGFDAPSPVALGAAATVLAAVGVWLALRRSDPGERRGAFRAGRLALACVGLPTFLALIGIDYLDARNVGALAVLLVILVAVGYRTAPRIGLVAGGALCVMSVAVLAATASQPKYRSEDWRAAARFIGPAQERRVIVVTPGQPGRKPFEFYLPRTWTAPSGGVAVRELDVVELPVQGSAKPGRTAVARLATLGVAGFTRGGWTTSPRFVIARYRASRPVLVSPGRLAARVGRQRPVVLLERPVAQAPRSGAGRSTPQARR